MLRTKPSPPLIANPPPPIPNPKLYLRKGQLLHYFNTSRTLLSVSTSCEKLHKDSNADLESSSATTPCCCSEPDSKRTTATNTDLIGSPWNTAWKGRRELQPQFGSENYFMFPTYGVKEQGVQTGSAELPICKEVSGKSMCLVYTNLYIGKKCEAPDIVGPEEMQRKVFCEEARDAEKVDLCINKILKEISNGDL